MKEEKKVSIINTLKGKCSNCGKPMKEVSNENWQIYCNEKECEKAFRYSVISPPNTT